jgi:hypothetical protein
MRPVVLSIIEGKKYILGSFDTEMKIWWKSEPFPGDVSRIGQPLHVYGSSHVCICNMADGTYSIYRSNNEGKSWSQVYNTASTIYSIQLIDYGWAIASTSTGWIHSSADSGTTWTSLSSQAPGCKNFINISSDVFFGHDGDSVWKSLDHGANWSKVLSRTRWYSKPFHLGNSWGSGWFSWTGKSYPAIAGEDETVLVGFGPYLVISEDLGQTWMVHPSTEMANWAGGSFAPRYGNYILQIVKTKSTAGVVSTDAFMIRNLISGTVHYMQTNGGIWPGTSFGWSTRFYLPFKGESNGIISAYDVLNPGSSDHSMLATVTSYDNSNNPVVKMSVDGGWTWSTIDTTAITVYEGDPTQEIYSNIGQQTFDEEYYTTYSWVGHPCHNSGHYIVYDNKTVRGISFDIELLLKKIQTKGLLIDELLLKSFNKTFPIDILMKKAVLKTLPSDSLLLKTVDSTYLIRQYSKKGINVTYSPDIITVLRKTKALPTDILMNKTVDKTLKIDTNVLNTREAGIGIGVNIIDSHVNEILNSIEKYIPQAPDIVMPTIAYHPYDSRTEEI